MKSNQYVILRRCLTVGDTFLQVFQKENSTLEPEVLVASEKFATNTGSFVLLAAQVGNFFTNNN
jgi:hypothetical protein